MHTLEDQMMTRFWVGLLDRTIVDINASLEMAKGEEFKFLATHLIPKDNNDEFSPFCDKVLSSDDWRDSIVSYIPRTEFQYFTNSGQLTRIKSLVSYANHVNIQTMVIECPKSKTEVVNLARLLTSETVVNEGSNSPKYLLHLPIHKEIEFEDDPWALWSLFRLTTNLDCRYGIALELSKDFPDDPIELRRWLGEPIKMLLIPTQSFVSNKLGFPVFIRSYKSFVCEYLAKNPRDFNFMVIKDNQSPNTSLKLYSQYLKSFRAVRDPNTSPLLEGYEDCLQIPLQPLMENLESGAYEVFERCHVKYEKYFEAIKLALSRFDPSKPVVILVIGAGRGPLVHQSLRASKELNTPVKIYAVEKNPNAIVTLCNEQWSDYALDGSTVEIIKTDIRDLELTDKADIVISELLGSFSDNELSPECIDGCWRCAQPGAICIPESYRSYIQPIMCHAIYADAHHYRDKERPFYQRFERNFVVNFKNFFQIDDAQKLFTFEHAKVSSHPKDRDNNRYDSKTFISKVDCVLHGFAGYFDCTLYDDITLSTVPGHATYQLISWFPFFIPLNSPLALKKNDKITVHMWRVVGKSAVWYEWCLSEPTPTPIQNSNGRASSVGLY